MSEMLTPGQYIQHHLGHLTLNLKTFTIGEGGGFGLSIWIPSLFQ